MSEDKVFIYDPRKRLYLNYGENGNAGAWRTKRQDPDWPEAVARHTERLNPWLRVVKKPKRYMLKPKKRRML